MNENIKLQEQALKALISINRNGVENLLKSNGYKISKSSTSNDLYAFLIVAMAKDSQFTNNVLDLLKQASSIQSYRNASEDLSSIISGALQGLGMVTTTWQNTAQIKADTSKYNTVYTVDGKKSNTIVIAATVGVAIILIGIMAVIVIKSTK